MTRFDPSEAHTLVCIQNNRGIPEFAQECVCPPAPRLPRTFQPTFEIEGPASRTSTLARRVCAFLIGLAIVAAVNFIIGAVLRHFGVI